MTTTEHKFKNAKLYFRYLRVDAKARKWGMYVTTCGRSQIAPNAVSYPPVEHPPTYDFDWSHGRILDEYQLIYIEEGSGTLETKALRLKVEGGNIILLRPGIWHRYRPDPKSGWRELWVGFGGQSFDFLFKNAFFADRLLFRVRESMQLFNSMEAIIHLAQENGPALQQTMAAHTAVALASLYAATLPPQAPVKSVTSLIQKARSIMVDPRKRDVPLTEIARLLGCSYSTFRRTFREEMGVSPHQYRVHLKISQAKELLLNTQLSVKEIAFQCGFQEEQHFCRLFKNRTGRTAGTFRAS